MNRNVTLYVVLSLAFAGNSFANSWDLQLLENLPEASSVKTVEMEKPAAGISAKVSPELIKEFLERGKNLKVRQLHRLASSHGELWDSLDKSERTFSTVLYSSGAIVTNDYSLLRWRFLTPNIIQFTNFEKTSATLVHLKNPTHPLTVEGKSFDDYIDGIKRNSFREQQEAKRQAAAQSVSATFESDPPYTIELTTATKGFDKKMCWVHARAGAIPDAGENGKPLVVMTLQKLQLSGSDIFYALNEMRTSDGGATWTKPVEHDTFARVPFSFENKNNLEITVCDFWPRWHEKTGKLLGTGHTVVYENNKVMHRRPRSTPYSIYNPDTHTWSPWKTIELPDEAKFGNAGAGCVQRFDLPNGDLLLPIYFAEIGHGQYSTTVLRCSFNGEEVRYLSHSNELTVPVKRGLYEPSITRFGDRLFLTMRNDDHGYVSSAGLGEKLNFSEPKKWTFDDGTELGNYNTQQHWVMHPEHGLFLVYTRKGAENDHVFRHRAPLFIAQIDLEKLEVIRATEQILVPEHGARLGNFGVTEVNPDETWVTVTEWMQAPGPNYSDPEPLIKRGADNRVWVAKLKWD